MEDEQTHFSEGGLKERTLQARVIACTKALRPKRTLGLTKWKGDQTEGRWGWAGPSLLAWSCWFSEEAPGRLQHC